MQWRAEVWAPIIAAVLFGRSAWRFFVNRLEQGLQDVKNGIRKPTALEMVVEDMRCVFLRDPAARSMAEVLTIYPGLQAINLHRLAHFLWTSRWKYSARLLSYLSRFITGVEIHPGAVIGRRFFIDHGLGVVIGETAEIGDDCTLYHQVTLGGTSWNPGKRHPTLGDNVIVGAGAKVLGPIIVNSGARIGANSVVIKDVPADKTVVGVPGRMISDANYEKRLEVARNLGFDAYGMQKDMPDPVANVIHKMLDHIHSMEQRQKEMCSVINKLGNHFSPPELDALNVNLCMRFLIAVIIMNCFLTLVDIASFVDEPIEEDMEVYDDFI